MKLLTENSSNFQDITHISLMNLSQIQMISQWAYMWESVLEIASADYSSSCLIEYSSSSPCFCGVGGLILGCDSSQLLLFCRTFSVPSLSMMRSFTIFVVFAIFTIFVILVILVILVVFMVSMFFVSPTPNMWEIWLVHVKWRLDTSYMHNMHIMYVL